MSHINIMFLQAIGILFESIRRSEQNAMQTVCILKNNCVHINNSRRKWLNCTHFETWCETIVPKLVKFSHFLHESWNHE